MFSKEEKEKLKEIYDHFNEIENIYLSLNKETQEKIADYHNESYNIPHCFRWGLQGTEELLKG